MIGIDIIEIDRIGKSLENPKFVQRVFSQDEIAYFTSKKNSAESAAGFFCAKEALLKALKCGISGVNLKEISVVHDKMGAPFFMLYGQMKQRMGNNVAELSISHNRTTATAIVLLKDRDAR